ncbi:NAD(P)/FAD-dependent oxidoreductase [Arenimonas sp.]|jgi:predicted Rossmann fold flavoprotein|uniref:NAD(P)/FAD-dependent oxidoreductase n=1 Tax=Arenimonas sp. TaxID=1872635 RepID=UPI0037C12111
MISGARDSQVLVIGGGAAGLMCAATAGYRGKAVTVLERSNRCGKKILMSGGGRCNFTNTGTGPGNFLSRNPHFCKSALACYRPADFIDLVERHGIAYHEKELGQLFCDDSSKQIIKLLLDECDWAGVHIATGIAISSIRFAGDRFEVETAQGIYRAEKLVVATGGLSIPSMGASGLGYSIARQFGHALVETRAGLVPFTLSGKPLEQYAELAGVALPIAVRIGGTEFRNALLFTHRGLSGPAILQISSYWELGQPIEIDLLPGRDATAELIVLQQQGHKAELKTVLAKWLPKRLAQLLCTAFFSNKPISQYKHAELRDIAFALQHWRITPSGTEGYRTAEVTLGGVDTEGVSSSSFESKHQPGLYFIGEVLDVTGHLGGYNFQWAWASGYAAGGAL